MNRKLAGAALSLFCLMNNSKAMDKASEPLSPREQNIASIGAHAARGDMTGLRKSLDSGLDAGLTISEVREVLVQMYAYCGFPRSLNALNTLMALVKERKTAGITDKEGTPPGPLPKGRSIDFGTVNQTKLCGAPVKGELFEFAPAIDEYLKGHLFGDIFGRDNLDWKTRELATIAALSAMTGTGSQLDSHIRIGRNNGLSDAQIAAVLAIAREESGDDAFPKGDRAPAHFTGKAWVSPLVNNKDYDLSSYNVTFAPGARNDWHSHTVGQVLLCTVGTGYYQERGKAARKLAPGDVVEIPARTEHWHGAAPDSNFTHIGITPKMAANETNWGAPVTDAEYKKATDGNNE